jgi:toxin-antitoxin system PIN domain toxin
MATEPQQVATENTALLDLNVLIALAWPQHIHHERARSWFSRLGERTWATTPVTESGFVRLSLNRAVVGTEMSGAGVLEMVRRFSDLPGHVFLADTARLAYAQFKIDRLATAGQATDFHLLAVARATRSVLVTMDKAIPNYLAKSDRYLVELLL